MILEYATLIVIIIVLGLIIAFLYIKDKELVKNLSLLENSILELKSEKIVSNNSEESNQKDDTQYKDLDSKIYELGESLIKIVRSIKNLDHNQKEVIQRVEKVENQLKLTMLSSSSNLNENDVISLLKIGNTPEEIAKELNAPLGEVEFIIKIANLNDN